MASQLYIKGAQNILEADIDFIVDDIQLLFYSSTYNAAHEFVADLTGASIIDRSGNLAGKTVTNGVFDANDLTVTTVSGSAFNRVILYKWTGSDSTSPLVAIFEISSFTPTGSDVNVVFHASGLFSIA